jgi:hypothetical protein
MRAADPWGKPSGGPKRNSGDTRQLVELLLSDEPIVREVRDGLADLLERCQLILKQGKGSQRPVYEDPPSGQVGIAAAPHLLSASQVLSC